MFPVERTPHAKKAAQVSLPSLARTSPRGVARGSRSPRRTTASSSTLRRSSSVSSERAREGESSGPCAKKTLANLLSSERHQWRENESGRFVDNVLTQCKDGGGSPFGVELELVRSQDFAVSTSASSVSPKVRNGQLPRVLR